MFGNFFNKIKKSDEGFVLKSVNEISESEESDEESEKPPQRQVDYKLSREERYELELAETRHLRQLEEERRKQKLKEKERKQQLEEEKRKRQSEEKERQQQIEKERRQRKLDDKLRNQEISDKREIDYARRQQKLVEDRKSENDRRRQLEKELRQKQLVEERLKLEKNIKSTIPTDNEIANLIEKYVNRKTETTEPYLPKSHKGDEAVVYLEKNTYNQYLILRYIMSKANIFKNFLEDSGIKITGAEVCMYRVNEYINRKVERLAEKQYPEDEPRYDLVTEREYTGGFNFDIDVYLLGKTSNNIIEEVYNKIESEDIIIDSDFKIKVDSSNNKITMVKKFSTHFENSVWNYNNTYNFTILYNNTKSTHNKRNMVEHYLLEV